MKKNNKRSVWYEIQREEEVIPLWRAELDPVETGRHSVTLKDGTTREVGEERVLSAQVIGDWEERKVSGFIARIKVRLGRLTFEYKRLGPFRKPVQAKAAAKRALAEAIQWHADLNEG